MRADDEIDTQWQKIFILDFSHVRYSNLYHIGEKICEMLCNYQGWNNEALHMLGGGGFKDKNNVHHW